MTTEQTRPPIILIPQESYDLQTKHLEEFGNVIDWENSRKTKSDLLAEIASGECSLEIKDGKLERHVRVVNVYVFASIAPREFVQLYEAMQVPTNGASAINRELGWVSEKIVAGEKSEKAGTRAIGEELKIDISDDDLERLNARSVVPPSAYANLPAIAHIESFRTVLPADILQSRIITLPAEQGVEEIVGELAGQEVAGFKEVQDKKVTYFIWGPVRNPEFLPAEAV